jgi:hypothetical protein
MPDAETEAVLAHPVVTALKGEVALLRRLVWSQFHGAVLTRPEHEALIEILGDR